MKVLRCQIQQRLMENQDFKALLALDAAIAQVEGKTRIMAIGQQWRALTGAGTDNALAPRTRPITQVEAAIQALEEAGRPLPTAELMERAKALGAEIGGADPVVNFGSSLSRDKRFVNIRFVTGGRAWWFAGRKWNEQLNLSNPARAETETADSP
jgi:hypothetical protein